PLARVRTRSNLRPARKMAAQKRATRSRPSYSKGIGGIEMKTSSVKRATSASRSADSYARTNFAMIASSEGELAAGGGPAVLRRRRLRPARARLGARFTDLTGEARTSATPLAPEPASPAPRKAAGQRR